jgi:wyosine [tRNA(Phe)-imidazoG37] synthetase (radical SAM superfamily)
MKNKESSMLLNLQSDIIYGPVRSRRLGPSLGVNILPARIKVCTFDCLYCQYGRCTGMPPGETGDYNFPTVAEVLSALEQALKNPAQPLAYITFSGNGEPTLHPDFKKMVEGVREVRDVLCPTARTAILSNSTTVNNPVTREALAMLDMRIMKLDAGTEEMFCHYNRPARGITLADTVKGLASLGNISLQSLFTTGPEGNFTPEHLSHWVEQVKKISPLIVQIYTLARQSPTETITALDRGDLMHIRRLLEKEDIPAAVFA